MKINHNIMWEKKIKIFIKLDIGFSENKIFGVILSLITFFFFLGLRIHARKFSGKGINLIFKDIYSSLDGGNENKLFLILFLFERFIEMIDFEGVFF